MLMKKIFSVIFSLILVLSLAACGTDGGNDSTSDDLSTGKGTPVVSLLCDKTAVSAGEEIEVRVHVDNAPRTACFDIYVQADEAAFYISSESFVPEMIIASNVEESDPQSVIIRGMVAATFDVYDRDVCTISYKISEDVEAGSKISLSLRCPLYQLGLDASGNEVYSVGENIVLNGLVLEVQ